MKCIVLSVILIIGMAMTIDVVNGQCPQICTADYRPVCGFNGSCYRQFGNQCSLNVQNCQRGGLSQVNLSLCERARSGTDPNVRLC